MVCGTDSDFLLTSCLAANSVSPAARELAAKKLPPCSARLTRTRQPCVLPCTCVTGGRRRSRSASSRSRSALLHGPRGAVHRLEMFPAPWPRASVTPFSRVHFLKRTCFGSNCLPSYEHPCTYGGRNRRGLPEIFLASWASPECRGDRKICKSGERKKKTKMNNF